MVTDNGPSFTSDEFKRFVETNEIEHVTSVLFQDVGKKVESQQAKQKQAHDTTKPLLEFNIGDRVFPDTTVKSSENSDQLVQQPYPKASSIVTHE